MTQLFGTPVREYMSETLVSVRPGTNLDEVQRLLDTRDISSVPVTDDAGALVGIVSTTDLLRVARLELAGPRSKLQITQAPRAAEQVMQREVCTIDERQPVREAASVMVQNRVHRLVVLRAGKPVAVLSTRDVMHAVLLHHIELPLAHVMTTPVETIELGDPIDLAIARLDDANVRGLVVVDGRVPVGVFTHTEAIKARALPRAVLTTAVEQVMSYEILALDVGTPLYRVAGQAIATRARRILAVEGHELRGIATGFDLTRVATMDLP